MHWLRFWTQRQQRRRRRRAYFRPSDTSALDAALVNIINQIVTVRFVEVASANSRFVGQRLYCIVGHETSAPKFMRPEREFDFLE